MTDKILIGFPTSDAKMYCRDEFISGLRSSNIPKTDILCVDTSHMPLELKHIYSEFNYIYSPFKSKAMTRVVKARKIVADYAIINNYEYALFIDSDAIIDNNTIPLLLRHQKDVVSAVLFTLYPNHAFGPVPFVTETQRLKVSELGTGLKNAFRIGFGCVLIKTDILKQIKIRCERNEQGTMTLGEDFCFSDDCRKLGIPLYVDTNIQIPHKIVGQWDYETC